MISLHTNNLISEQSESENADISSKNDSEDEAGDDE